MQTPSFNPRERVPHVGPLQLPAEGRKGDVPPWPLPGRVSKTELEVWGRLWVTPQAVAWERLGWTLTVARYCRVMTAASKPGAGPAINAAATALEDRLGLTPKAMRMLLWVVAPDEVMERRVVAGEQRERLRAVE